ncbi:MAG: hypothetical protein U9N51_12085 [Bacteroidota bacterium]|nr:hypothetical protein [Bacteroidota bacterium]
MKFTEYRLNLLLIFMLPILLLHVNSECKSQDIKNDSVINYNQKNENERLRKNSVYLELFGNSFYQYNMGYDRILFDKRKNKLSIASGIGYLPLEISSLNCEWFNYIFTSQVNYFTGKEHHFETGLGFTYIGKKNSDYYEMLISLRIGYRYQKQDGGLFIKSSLTPLYFLKINQFGPWAGVVVGWTF